MKKNVSLLLTSTAFYIQKKNSDDESGISQCLARCAIRNIISENCIDLMKQLLQSKSDVTRYYAVYAISRFRKSKFVDPFIPEIEVCMIDTSPDVRMCAATSAGYISDSLKFLSLIMQGLRDKDWRVRINSLHAITFSKFKLNRELTNTIIQLVESKNNHIAIEALQTLATKMDEFERLNSFNTRLKIYGTDFSHFKDQSVRIAAFSCFARMYPMDANDILLAMIPLLRGIQREKCIEALGFVNHQEKYFYSTNVIDALIKIPKKLSEHRIVMSVLIAMNEMKNHLRHDDKKRIFDFCLKCMDSEDIALITQSAEMCSDTTLLNLNNADIALQARKVLSRLKEVTDVEPIVALCNLLTLCNDELAVDVLKEKLRMPDKIISTAAAKALSKITGKDYMNQITIPIPPVFTDYDWDYLSTIKENESVLIRTNRGSIIVQLNVREAPFTVMRFLKLVDQKFYDGLPFHRVVSNFVVQGGDPRGDGWGGPGWTMRSEFGLNHFERGSIGIASSGKDTEGSQFFITHCATPHLDGRYTNFGKVLRGMSDVDRIQIGDKILSIDRRY